MTQVADDAIDVVMTDLERRLARSGSFSKDLLAEIETGLRDSQDAFESRGLGRAEAGQKAVEAFGDLDLVTSEVKDEVVARSSRRTLTVLTIGYPLMMLAWVGLEAALPDRSSLGPEHWIGRSFFWIALIAMVGSICVLVSLRHGARRGRIARLSNYASAAVAIGTAVVTLTMALLNMLVGPPSLAVGWLVVAETAVEICSGALVLTLLVLASRGLRYADATS